MEKDLFGGRAGGWDWQEQDQNIVVSRRSKGSQTEDFETVRLWKQDEGGRECET